MTREPRLLVYSQDGLGLGHLRRTTLLAQEFLWRHRPASVLTISDSPLGRFFSSSDGHDYLKLPSIRKAAPGEWHPINLDAPFSDVLALRREIIRSTLLAFRPDVLLVDHMPHGAMGELVPALDAVGSLPVRVVLGLRDILDAPTTVQRRWRLEGATEAVEEFYDAVLVYGSQDVFDVGREYGWSAAARSLLRYCGYVCAPTATPASGGTNHPPTDSSTDGVRRRFLKGVPDGQLIVAMAGGGADAYPMFDALLTAMPRVAAERPTALVVVTGPFLPPAQRQLLRRRARGQRVQVLTSVPDSTGYLSAADVVVAMAGYNTSAEVLGLRKRALLIPRRGPSAEQQMRARLFAERGWVDWLHPDRLDADELARALLAAMDGPGAVVASAPDLRGRQVAAGHLSAEGRRAGLNGRHARPAAPHDVEALLARG